MTTTPATTTGTITRDELQAEIAAGGVTLLEALPVEHYDKEHLPGARNLPLDDIDALAPTLIAGFDSPVVVYCANAACQNSHIAAARLHALGYREVRVYAGGKEDWFLAGLAFE
jgi:rhodanese-related sulfurtransferase